MGYVATFCQVSGCNPDAASELQHDYRLEEAFEELKDHPKLDNLKAAIRELAEEEEKRAEVTVVELNRIYNEYSDALRLVPHCGAGAYFEFGSVDPLDGPPHDGNPSRSYLVSYGPCMYLMSAAVPILFLATEGRMNLQRVWTLVMTQGHLENDKQGYVLKDVEYGAIEPLLDQFLCPLAALSGVYEDKAAEVVKAWLEKGETVEELKDVVVHEGGWWPWMSPDDFPLKPSSVPSPPPTCSPLTSASAPKASLASLPLDLLLHISSLLPLPSLLALALLCKSLRHTLLSSPSTRSQLASSWLTTSGRFFLPLRPSLGGIDFTKSDAVEERQVRLGKVETEKLEEGDDWWEYLRRCKASGSMRNRERVWKAALSVEEAAEKIGA
ncbi:hypothetical protein JCM8097_008859 [Rhodosporidiobolus ruineniae]